MLNTKRFAFAVSLLLMLGCEALAQQKPLKVFVLVGQSNMQGHAHVKTLPHMAMDEKAKTLHAEIVDSQGKPKVHDQVWISYLSSKGTKSGKLTTGFGADDNKIGPELTFGIYMQKRLGEPILIIKTAWGGKSINTDFRSPSAGPYKFNQEVLDRLKTQGKDVEKVLADKKKATGVFYRQSIDHTKKVLENIGSVYPEYDEERGYELAGLVWFQGWNDMVDSGTYPERGKPGAYDAYSEVLANMIRDFRKDLSAPKLPFVIGVMGVEGPTDKYSKQQQRYRNVHQSFRDAMAAPASLDEFKGNVAIVRTEEYWDSELGSLVAREGEFRGKVRRFSKDKKYEDLLKELKQVKELSEQDLLVVEKLKKGGKSSKAVLEELRKKQFSDREFEILNKGKSNAAFHYLGCAKIMAGIGKAFAEKMPLK